MSKSPIIELKKVNFRYNESAGPALIDVDLAVFKGGFYSIIGPNGGGKSTLLKLILGLLKPDSGTITVLNHAPEAARTRIGYMPQTQEVDAAFPIRAIDVVLMGRLKRWFLGRYQKADYEAALAALDELGVASLAYNRFAGLSGGQKQRVLIARALVCRPSILLLDEPTANIDPGAEEQFYQTLNELRQRMTLLTVSHDLGFVQKEVDQVICVNQQVSIHNLHEVDRELVDDLYQYGVHQILHEAQCGGGHRHE